MIPADAHRDCLVPAAEIERRTRELQSRLEPLGVAAAWLDHLVDRLYLTGTTQNGVVLLPVEGAPVFFVRKSVPRHLVAVTGSTGKTTTKELLAAMLARRFRVERSPGNLNNLYGFPVALLGIDPETEWMVAEMGMSRPGELGDVARLGRPDVAVYTNVKAVHLEFFAGLRAIADAKAEFLEGLAEDGLVVAIADDP